jgi:hypothetical protein
MPFAGWKEVTSEAKRKVTKQSQFHCLRGAARISPFTVLSRRKVTKAFMATAGYFLVRVMYGRPFSSTVAILIGLTTRAVGAAECWR